MTRNRLALLSLTAVFVAALALPATRVLAQATAIPDAIKTGGDAERIRAAVVPAIRGHITRLAGTDPVARAAAREALVADSGVTANPQPSAAYLDVYCTELNNELVKLLSIADISVESRLNATIVAARVARADRNARLAAFTMAALEDKQEAVVLWALKAAGQLMPGSLGLTPQKNQLLTRVSATGARLADTVLIVDVYDALTLTSHSTPPEVLRRQLPDPQWKTLVPLVWPELFKVWQQRLQKPPGDPSADEIPAGFVGSLRTWPALSPDQQVQAMTLLAQQAAITSDRAVNDAANREAHLNVFRRTAAAVSVIGDKETNAALSDAGKKAAGLGNGANPASIQTATTNLLTAIRSISKFSTVTTAPTSGPS